VLETTALGAAFLAGLGVGMWENEDAIAAAWAVDRSFAPQLSAEGRDGRLRAWRTAVAKA
jgi:glycerol kinase